MDGIPQGSVPHTTASRFLVILFSVILLLLGAVFCWVGRRAIHTRHYEFAWEQSGGVQIGPFGWGTNQASGVDTFNGPDAVRVGTGLLLFGAMFALWGILAFWSAIRPRRWEIPRRPAASLSATSLALLTASAGCLLPPWKMGSGIGPAMWSTMVLVGLYLLLLRKKWVKYLFPALILLTLIALQFTGGRWPWGIVLAVFVGLAFAAHGAMLYVWLHKEKDPQPASAIPAAGHLAQAAGAAANK